MPQLLKYPKITNLDDNTPLRDIFCYIIRHYGDSGISILVHRDPNKDQTGIIFGDWDGNTIDLSLSNDISKMCKVFAKTELVKLIEIMKLIGITQSQYYFSTQNDSLTLCDMQLSLNKMAGPGMIRDIFSKVVKTQEVLKTEIIDDRVINAIKQGNGSYEGNIIIKPSKFRLSPSKDNYTPLYAELIR